MRIRETCGAVLQSAATQTLAESADIVRQIANRRLSDGSPAVAVAIEQIADGFSSIGEFSKPPVVILHSPDQALVTVFYFGKFWG